MSRFGSRAVLELYHFDTGPFWKWAVLTPILVRQYGLWLSFFKTKQFIELCFFFLIINFTDRNKKHTEGVIMFPRLLCKKKAVDYVMLFPFLHQLCVIVLGRVTHPSTNRMQVA